MVGSCLSASLIALTMAAVTGGPPVVEVSYNIATETITVSQDPLSVPPGIFILVWLKEPQQASAPWRFEGLEVSAPAGCFEETTVHDRVMNIRDKNVETTCHGTFKYSVSVFDEGRQKIVTLDPEIENLPQGN